MPRRVKHTDQYYISRIMGFVFKHSPSYIFYRLRELLEEEAGHHRVTCESCEKRVDHEKAVYGGDEDCIYFCQTCAAGLMADTTEESTVSAD